MKPSIHLAIYAGPAAIDLPAHSLRGERGVFARAPEQRRFDVRASAAGAEIDIYDDIGYWGVSAEQVRKELRAITAPEIIVRINSRGGDVFDGVAIHNDLVAHPARVHVMVSGLAASAASIIAMAGDRITVPSSAFLMIHEAWTVAAGNKAKLLKTIAALGTIDAALATTYAQRSGLPREEVEAMMAAETWLDGEAAVAKGFADAAPKPEAEPAPQARIDLSMFAAVPDRAARLYGLSDSGGSPAGNSAFQAELARLSRLTQSLRA